METLHWLVIGNLYLSLCRISCWVLLLLRTLVCVQPEQINMAVVSWYLITSDLYSVCYCTRVNWTCHFLQGTRITWPCLTGPPAGTGTSARGRRTGRTRNLLTKQVTEILNGISSLRKLPKNEIQTKIQIDYKRCLGVFKNIFVLRHAWTGQKQKKIQAEEKRNVVKTDRDK